MTSDINGCSVMDTLDVEVYPTPMIDLGNDTSVCNNVEYTLDAGAGYVDYEWSSGEFTQAVIINNSGLYSVSVVDTNGCEGTESVTINVIQSPEVDLGPDTTFCTDFFESYTLSVNGIDVLWSDGSTGNDFTVSGAGTYWVQVAGNGCTTVDSVTVTLDPCIGINEPGKTIYARVYPNPSNSQVTVELVNVDINQNITVKVMDVVGQQLQVEQWKEQVNNNGKSLDVSNLAVGSYYIVLEAENWRKVLPIQKY
tara:strand:- start:514 stop:1272 length:759 start_codon:yes stop_codon:yes gene_type:complete